MASVIFNTAKERMGEGGFDPVTQDARCLLLTGTTSTPDDPDHLVVNDIVADEGSDASYARKVLGSKTGTRNDTANRWEFDFADIVWSNLAAALGTVLFAILFVQVTTDTDSWLVSAHDIADTTPDGTDFTLVVGSTGAIHIT